MTLFDWFRGSRSEDRPDEVFENLPWEQHPSILEHIKAHNCSLNRGPQYNSRIGCPLFWTM